MTSRPMIRNLAVGIPRRGDAILVSVGHDTVKHQTYYHALGGGIEFGERADAALRREFEEAPTQMEQ